MNAAKQQTLIGIDPEKALSELKWLGLAVCTDPTRANIACLYVDNGEA